MTTPGGPSGRRWLLLGSGGSTVIALSSIAIGALPVRDPFARIGLVLAWRDHPTSALIGVYVGLALLVTAWLRLGQAVRRGEVAVGYLLRTLTAWTAPLLLAEPLFSRDVYSYLAQGVMFGSHLDPYRMGPGVLGGELAAGVSPVWQNTPAPYGPAFLATTSAVMSAAGGRVVLGILLLRLICVGAVAAIVACLLLLARRTGADPARAIWLGALNPVVPVHLVAGVHNDVLMVGLLLCGVVAAVYDRPLLAGGLLAVAALVKVPALLAVPFLAAARPRPVRGLLAMSAVALGVMVGVTAAMGTWYGWLAAIGGTVQVHNGLSVTTDLGDLISVLNRWLGVTLLPDPVTVMRVLGGLIAAGALAALAVRMRRRPVLAVGLALGTLLLLGPVVHPWYLVWTTIPLAAATGRGRVVRAAVAVSAAAAFIPVPSGESNRAQTGIGLLVAAATLLVAWALTATHQPSADVVVVPAEEDSLVESGLVA